MWTSVKGPDICDFLWPVSCVPWFPCPVGANLTHKKISFCRTTHHFHVLPKLGQVCFQICFSTIPNYGTLFFVNTITNVNLMIYSTKILFMILLECFCVTRSVLVKLRERAHQKWNCMKSSESAHSNFSNELLFTHF